MSEQHFLVVHEESDDGLEIEHPDSCPTEAIYGGRVEVRICPFGELDMEVGLEEFFHLVGTPGEGEAVTVGRHPSEYWSDGRGDDVFDCGLRLAYPKPSRAWAGPRPPETVPGDDERCRVVEVDGVPVRVLGGREMDAVDRAMFAEVVRAAQRRLAAEAIARRETR